MRTTVAQILAIGLLFVVLSGCATTSQMTTEGLPNAEHPEYLIHPFRLIALPLHVTGNILQYGLVEPLYFGLAATPDLYGLSVEEQRYLAEREAVWGQWWRGERPLLP